MDRIKLIASDIDGTLLFNFAKELDPEVCVLIRRMMEEKGLVFLAASGRQYTNLQKLFAPVKDRIGYVCENGALSIIGDQVIHQEFLEKEVAYDIIDAMNATEHGEAVVSGLDGVYFNPKNPDFTRYMKEDVGYNVTVVPDLKHIDIPYMKISMFGYDEKAPEVLDMKKRFGDKASVVTSGNGWLDVMPKGVHKGFALKKVFDYLGVSPLECVAVGDNENDKEMLELVGYPVAVESGLKYIVDMTPYHVKNGMELFEKIVDGSFEF